MKRITTEEELKKNPELKQEDIAALKEWISKQDHLPDPIPDELIIWMLHSCYYRLEQAKITLDNYLSVKTHGPEIFSERDIGLKNLTQAFNTTYILPLKKVTDEGYRVMFCRLRNPDPNVYVFADAMKLFSMAADYVLLTHGTEAGGVVVIDMSDVTFSHVTKLSVPVVRKMIFFLQEAMPVRLKGIHYINIVPFMDTIMSIIKPFMNKAMLDMLHLHTGTGDLYKYVPQEILPIEYGGKAGSLEEMQGEMLDFYKANLDWYKEEEKLRVNEDRRPAKDKKISDLFGMEGSFKKLVVD